MLLVDGFGPALSCAPTRRSIGTGFCCKVEGFDGSLDRIVLHIIRWAGLLSRDCVGVLRYSSSIKKRSDPEWDALAINVLAVLTALSALPFDRG